MALFENDFDKFQALTNESPTWVFTKSSLWRFGCFASVFLIIGLLKFWGKNKKGLLDSIVSFLIAFSLIHLGFYNAKFTNSIINFPGGIFSNDLKIICLINGLFWTTLGLIVIWFAVKKNYTQQRL